MFITIVALAIIAAPNIPEMLGGTVPRLPGDPNGVMYTLALAGGVGGTITLSVTQLLAARRAEYTPKWMKVMRIDNTMAYVITGIFVIGIIVGAEVSSAPPASR